MKAFISHSSKDEEFVQRLATELRSREGIDAWLAQWEIKPGDKIPEKLEEGLAEAEVFILVLSPDSVNSPWVEYERQIWITIQIDEEKRAKQEFRLPGRHLIPVLYRNCQKPKFLLSIQHVEINDQNFAEGIKRLASAIRGESQKKPPLKDQKSHRVIATSTAKPSPMSRGDESRDTAQSVVLASTASSSPGIVPRLHAMTLLKRLLHSKFQEVVLFYGMDPAYLPNHTDQVEQAIALIRYAIQQEGENIPKLLGTIYTVAP